MRKGEGHGKGGNRYGSISLYWPQHRQASGCNSAAAQEAWDEIRKADGEALAIKKDTTDPTQAKQLFDKTIEAYGRIDVAVNNAGIMMLSPIAKGDVEAFDKVIATNLRGT
jgi:3-oxoacyl-[acyl-carrier protein] reductase